jgi:predicted alpha/beta hydrolase family esterase
MTHQVLFIQGGGEDAHDQWDNRLVESLERDLGPDYEVHYPRMPHEADPKYAAWKAALKQQFDRLDDGATLIGHSIGGTIVIRTLADEPIALTFAGIFLIAAPFVGDGGWHSEDIRSLPDLGARLSKHTPIYLYHGSKDETAPFGHVDLYAQTIPQAVVRKLSGRDHQLNNDMSEVAADIRRLRAVRLSSVQPVPPH